MDAALIKMQQVPGFEHVQFIILYGSAAEKRMTAESDIDFCIYYDGDRAEAAHFRHKVLSGLPGTHYDIQVFQQLPLYVRVEVLKGTPVFTRNTTFLYEKATETIRDFKRLQTPFVRLYRSGSDTMKKGRVRETIIRIKIKEIVDGVSLVL